jgi:protein involved in polysaccharide export with SLBB domain
MTCRILRLSTILMLGLQLGGCLTDFGPVVSDSPPVAPHSVASRLQAGDQLKVIVYGEDALSGIYQVSPAGTISMPLVGPVVAAGRTASEVQRALANAYANGKFLQEPKITVAVASYAPIYVFGEVLTPGRYAYTEGIDVLGAVATAGGLTYRASRNFVLIRHPGQQVWQQYSLATPVPIEPGDVIRIPERYY